eukprot:551903-Prymnesium_polylepis.1
MVKFIRLVGKFSPSGNQLSGSAWPLDCLISTQSVPARRSPVAVRSPAHARGAELPRSRRRGSFEYRLIERPKSQLSATLVLDTARSPARQRWRADPRDDAT